MKPCECGNFLVGFVSVDVVVVVAVIVVVVSGAICWLVLCIGFSDTLERLVNCW